MDFDHNWPLARQIAWLAQLELVARGFYTGDIDGLWGPRSQKALDDFAGKQWHTVIGSSFADSADVAAFNRCRAEGNSDDYCFKFGDNGIGKWGHNTAQDVIPMCALPPEDWQVAGKTGGSSIEVKYKDIIVKGILGDTMPHKANIHNHAGIDLNPAFAKKLNLKPPFLLSGVSWRWI